MQLKNAVLAAPFVNFCYYISIWLQNNCNNNYYAYIYLISHTKPYHDFGFVSINHASPTSRIIIFSVDTWLVAGNLSH